MADRTVSVVLSADVVGYERAMGRAEQATTKVADAGDKSTSRLRNSFDTTAKTAGVVFNAAVAGATALGVSVAQTGVTYNSLQQNSRAALSVILGSTEAVTAQMAALDDLVSRSPFGKDTFITAQQTLLAFGYAAEDVIPTLDAVQNAVAAAGRSSTDLEGIVFVLAQIQAAGKVTATDLMQLGQRGVNAAEVVGSQMDLTGAQIKEMITNSELSVDDFLSHLTTGLAEQFGGATDLIKQQWTGALDRIKAAIREIGSQIMEPFISKEGGGQAVIWANDYADALGAVRDKTEMVTDAVMRRLEPALSAVTPGFEKIRSTVEGISFDDVNRGLDTMSEYAVPIAGLVGWLASMGTQIPIISKLGFSINPVLGGIVGLTAASPQLRGVLVSTWEAFKPGIDAAGSLMTVIGQLTTQIVGAAAPGLESLGVAGAQTVVMFLDLLTAASPILGVLVPLVSGISDLVGVVTQLPTPVLGVVAAFALIKASNIGTIFTKGASAAQALNERMALQSALAKMSGTQLSTMGAAAAVARSSVSGLGLAMKATFLSNAPMLALTALVTVLGAFAQSSADAKTRADSYRQALQGVADTAEDTSAALERVARNNLVTGENMDWGWLQRLRSGYDSAADAIDGLGLSVDEFTSALAGSDREQEAYRQKLNDLYMTLNATEGPFSRQAQAVDEVRIKFEQQVTATSRARKENNQLAESSGKAATSMRDEAKAAEEAQRALERKAAAQRAEIDAVYAILDAQAQLKEALEANNALTRDGAGKLDLYSASSRAVVEPLGRMVDGINRQAQAMVDQGATQSEINKFLEDSKGKFSEAAISAGAYEEEVGGLATQLGLVSQYKSMVIDMTVETEAASQDLDSLRQEIVDMQANDGYLTFSADTSPALSSLFELFGIVANEDGTYTIDADANPALAELLISLAEVDTATGIMTIDGNNQFVIDKANEAKASIDDKTGTIKIHGQDFATEEAHRIQGYINSLNATIKVGAAGGNSGYTGVLEADGGIIQAFANGAENHVAQIGRPGQLRIWNEDETGGEAYIPLAVSKRTRSERILEAVANHFGMQLIRRGAHAFADGAMLPSSPHLTQMSSALPEVYVDVEVVNPFTGEQVKAMVASTTVKFGGRRQ